MDGWETLIGLKARSETRDIPVLILSGVERTGVELDENAEAWITKPVSVDRLHDVLQRVPGQRPGSILSSETHLHASKSTLPTRRRAR
jgi:CheY-like chemotaxis protein